MNKLTMWTLCATAALAPMACGGTDGPGEGPAPAEQVASDEGDLAVTTTGDPGSQSYCFVAPLHCSKLEDRAVYPGCRAKCDANQVAMCIPGACTVRRAPICHCINRPQ